jgi:hypothetical protein
MQPAVAVVTLAARGRPQRGLVQCGAGVPALEHTQGAGRSRQLSVHVYVNLELHVFGAAIAGHCGVPTALEIATVVVARDCTCSCWERQTLMGTGIWDCCTGIVCTV